MKYQDLLKTISEIHSEEINKMPEPNEGQVKYVKNYWELDLANKEINSNFMLTTAEIYGKLYLKCRESRPELFI